MSTATLGLPAPVDRVLGDFVGAAREALGEDLRSVVLFGSAAEGRLRPTSDVNLILVLRAFPPAAADRLREPLRLARAAGRLRVMFLLEEEVQAAAEAFAAKFTDIRHRRRVLLGDDPFARLAIPRPAVVARLKQVLLNTILRLRAFYTERGLREEQLALLVADTVGPLRAAAAALRELEGQPVSSPKEALEAVASSLPGEGWKEVLARLTEAREKRLLPPGVAGLLVFRLIAIAQAMRARVQALP